MFKSALKTVGLPAFAGAAMLASSMAPASAFTLASPSLAPQVAVVGVDRVWWDAWGRWHPNFGYWRWRHHYHPYGWYHPYGFNSYYGYYHGYGYRHCWRGYWGQMRCAW